MSIIVEGPHGEQVEMPYERAYVEEQARLLCKRYSIGQPHTPLSHDVKHCPGCDMVAAYDDADPELVVWFMRRYVDEA